MTIFDRLRMWRLYQVWGEHMPETPEMHNTDPTFREEDSEPMPPATGVSCPTCSANRGEWCKTLTAGLPSRICHMARAQKFERAERHRADLSDALKRGV